MSARKKGTPVIELKDVWKTYTMGETEVHALRGVNVTIQYGEFVSIVGTSGSGKSTLMNMIGALDTPSKGVIKLDGIDISSLSESQLARIRGKKIGFIFQKFNLIPTLSAAGNVMLPLVFQGMDPEERLERAVKMLTMVDLGDRTDHKPNELSGGQQQRVAIARALVGQPSLLLADEPTGNLDSKTGATVMDFFKTLHKDHNTTIVLVTHDNDVAKQADRKIVLMDGQIVGGKK